MEYNAPPGSLDPNASYVNGIPGVQKGSPVNAMAVEYPQREILNVITAAGIAPSNAELDQLLQAINLIIQDAIPAVPDKYELCEFYFFRHPNLRSGFAPAQGGLLANAATLYPEAWAYLQTTEGQLLCKTEAEWQAMTTAIWHTNADGTTVGWNGIGGAPFYAPDTATGALRLPDLRGMYMEAAGYDGLDVGGVHGDAVRTIQGVLPNLAGEVITTSTGAFSVQTLGPGAYLDQVNARFSVTFDPSRVVPVAAKNQPRAWGALPCVYLGTPK